MSSDQCVGDFVELQRGNTYKSKLLDLPGPYLLGLASIQREGGFRSDKLRTYGGPTADKLLVRPGDIYVSLKDVTQSGDLLGSVARVPDWVEFGRVTQDTVKLTFKTKNEPREYLYWVLRTPQYRAYCRARGMGTTNLSLSREDFLSFPVPPLNPVRQAIVRVLEGIERKIQPNQQINQTLEQMAQAIFKSWFVDFEPVKAKIAALEAGGSEEDARLAAMQAIAGKTEAQLTRLQSEHPDHYAELRATADLFPSAMQESELGEIPVGWEVGPLGDLIQFNPRRTLRKGVLAPYLDMKNVPTAGHLAEEVVNREMKSGTKFINGDTLLARITPCLENGKTAYVDFLENGEVGWGSTEYIVMRSREGFPESIAYFVARNADFRQRAIQSMTGTSGRQRASAKALSEMPWLMYPRELTEHFDKVAKAYLELAKSHGDEMKALSEMRDTLLPKLLSGEITVPGAKEQTAETEEVADTRD